MQFLNFYYGKRYLRKKIAILTENGFEEIELTSPKKVLEEAGAIVYIVSPQKEKVKAWDHDHWSIELAVDVHLPDANPENYDALLIPGGVINPDKSLFNLQHIYFTPCHEHHVE
jgi:protease I